MKASSDSKAKATTATSKRSGKPSPTKGPTSGSKRAAPPATRAAKPAPAPHAAAPPRVVAKATTKATAVKAAAAKPKAVAATAKPKASTEVVHRSVGLVKKPDASAAPSKPAAVAKKKKVASVSPKHAAASSKAAPKKKQQQQQASERDEGGKKKQKKQVTTELTGQKDAPAVPAGKPATPPPPPQSSMAIPLDETGSAKEGMPDDIQSKAFQAFRLADTNNDGVIDVEELHKILRAMYGSITLPETNRVYQAVDENRSGKITFDEFLAAVSRYHWDLQLLVPDDAPDAALDFEWEIPEKQLHRMDTIGQGTFGVVYKAKWQGCAVAVKEIRVASMTPQILKEFRVEISILSKLRHPNIVLFMGASTLNTLLIVTEMIEGGSMDDVILQKEGALRLSQEQLLKVAYQTALGMNYLHQLNPQIIHRDLKPSNILLEKTSHNAKLIDFGLSCVRSPTQKLKEVVGTPIWMAPELLRGEKYTEKVDVYSYGLCLWGFFTGETPLESLSFDELINDVAYAGYRPELEELERQMPDLALLIKRCWDNDAATRPSFDTIVQHNNFNVFASLSL
eukprot:TRINITY_DN52_c2_g1_i2.p1 TRINITY_DN52_c2_g1~~TRINITY_DN52_c2_g1_i2.p1  ORF type:complete len:575 (-),score=143.27 TRINITY_DN52_c2_g1_i2:1559-3259(-)